MTTEAAAPSWMIVELMGHQRMAGEVTEVTVAGKGFLRIDVPASEHEAAFTRLISPDAVYALNPTTEALARRAAAAFRPRVVNEWDLPRALLPETTPAPLATRATCPECGDVYDDVVDGRPVCLSCLDASEDDGDGLEEADQEPRVEPPAFALSADDNQSRPRKRCSVRGCLEQLFSDEEERAGLCAEHIAAGEEDLS